MRNSLLSLATLSLVSVTAFASAPAEAQLGDMGNLATKPCNGRPQNITGMGNAIKLTGYCPSITVSGNGHYVIVEQVGQIIVSGNGHRVSYAKLNPDPKAKGKFIHPAKSVSGMGHLVEWTRGKMATLPGANSDDAEDE
jgi:Protein of unknown function (DUF3060)